MVAILYRVITRGLFIVFLGIAAALLGACASAPESPEVEIAGADYAQAFSAARDIVREHRFQVDRVDAAAGVISTGPKQTSGLFTPWDTEQSSAALELDDSVNLQQRRVRVTFEPREGGPADDLRGTDRALVCRFEVTLERIERPGKRVPPKAVRYSSQAEDPELLKRGMFPSYTVVVAQDPLLAARLAEELRTTLAKPAEQ